MTRARESIIDLDSTPYYHCISRCVRRAFLCGEDAFSGKSFEHRRGWIVERLQWLSQTFAIDIASYAIMSNHYHLVLMVNVDLAKKWSEANVIQRWERIYNIPPVVQEYMKKPTTLENSELAREIIEKWRGRLMDISWLMRTLNEYLARKANKEDHCKGRFWEGRFKSQPLLDQAAVLTAMAYVDLNPIRAKMARTLESSDFTSIQQRIQKLNNQPSTNTIPLVMLINSRHQNTNGLAFPTHDYLELVEWARRSILFNNNEYEEKKEPFILTQLNIQTHGFIELMAKTEDLSKLTAIGPPSLLTLYIKKHGRKFIKGLNLNRQIFA